MHEFDHGKYKIQARRNSSEEWTTWTVVDDPNDIRKHLNRVEELGYDARVTDPKITEWEKKYEEGHLLFSPVRMGQIVFAVVPGGEKYIVEEWQIKAIKFDGEKWYAIDEFGQAYEVRSRWCYLARREATGLAKELNGEDDED